MTARMLSWWLTCALLGSACNSQAPSAVPVPAGPTPVAAAAPRLHGYIFDSNGHPLEGARVEILDGPDAGISATSDERGAVSLPSSNATGAAVRASKDDYTSADVPLQRFFAVYLAPVDPPVTNGVRVQPGEYRLDVVFGSGCAFVPESLRHQSFTAHVERSSEFGSSGVWYGVAIPTLPLYPYFNVFAVGIDGNRVSVGEEGFLTWEIPPHKFFIGMDMVRFTATTPTLSGITFPFVSYNCSPTSANCRLDVNSPDTCSGLLTLRQ